MDIFVILFAAGVVFVMLFDSVLWSTGPGLKLWMRIPFMIFFVLMSTITYYAMDTRFWLGYTVLTIVIGLALSAHTHKIGRKLV